MLLLLSSTKCLAQLAVTAPNLEALTLKNNASVKAGVIKQLEEAARQSKTLNESASLLKKSADLYEKVNKNIKLIADIKQLTEDQIRLIKEAGSAINEAKKISRKDPRMLANYMDEDQIRLIKEAGSAINEAKKISRKDPRMLANYMDNVDRVIRSNRKNVELLNGVLTDGLRLTDGERLKLITDVQSNTEKNLTKIQTMKIMYSNYRSIQDLVFKK